MNEQQRAAVERLEYMVGAPEECWVAAPQEEAVWGVVVRREDLATLLATTPATAGAREGLDQKIDLALSTYVRIGYSQNRFGESVAYLDGLDDAREEVLSILAAVAAPPGGEIAELVSEAYRKGAMAALGCAPWDDADDFFSLVGLDYARGKPLPDTMPKPVQPDIVAGLNRQLTEQFELSSKLAARLLASPGGGSREEVAALIRSRVRLIWSAPDHADIDYRSTLDAADAILAPHSSGAAKGMCREE